MHTAIDHNSFYHLLGERIKAARTKEKYSQETLAKRLGFNSRVSIVNIEQGMQRVPVHTLIQIAQFLKIELQELIPPLVPVTKLDRESKKSLSEELTKLIDEDNGKQAFAFYLQAKSKT
jgi:transcriptional regulator with XRE-family HTH domain